MCMYMYILTIFCFLLIHHEQVHDNKRYVVMAASTDMSLVFQLPSVSYKDFETLLSDVTDDWTLPKSLFRKEINRNDYTLVEKIHVSVIIYKEVYKLR